MICYGYDDKGYFSGERKCQKDPLESKIQNKDVYLLPAKATLKEPLESKEGFKVKFENDEWIYEKITAPKEPEPYVPTVEEKQANVRSHRDYLLSKTDFTQLGDAPLTEEEKALYREYREYLRDYTETEGWYESNPLEFEAWNK